MRMVIWLAARRLLASWPVEAALGVGVLVIVTFISLVGLRSRAMAEAGLHYAFATRSSQLERAVQLVVQDRPLGYQDYQVLSTAVQKAFASQLGWLPVKVQPAGQSQSLPFVQRVEETPPAVGAPRAYLYFREEFESHARLVEGRWPLPSTPLPLTLEAVVGEPAAQSMRWATGQRLFLVPLGGAPEEKVEVRIVGIAKPLDSEDPYWLANLSPFYAGGGDAIEVPLVTGKVVFFDGFGQQYPMLLGNYWWHAFLDLDSLTAGATPRLKESLASLESEVNRLFPRSLVLTGLDTFIESYQRDLALSRLPLYLFASLVVSVVLYYLVLMAMMAAPERGAEAVMLRSRGATTRQVGYLIALGDGLILALPAMLLGPLMAWGLNTLLPVGYTCFQCSAGLSPTLFLAAGLASAICVMVFVVAGLGVARQGLAQFLRERGRPGGSPAIYRYGIDLVAVAALGLVWWQIRGQGGFVADRLLGGGIQADLSLVVAPALILLVAGLLGLRLYPWLLRLLAPLVSALGTAWAAHALRRMARDSLVHASLAVLVMQAVALGTFGAIFGTTLATSTADRANYSVGGDIVATLPDRYATPVEVLSQRARVVSGVEALSTVYRGRLSSPRGGVGAYTVLAAEPAELAQAAWFRRDLADKDVKELLAPLEHKAGVAQGVVLPNQTEAVGVWVRPSISHPGSNLYLRLRDATGIYASVLGGNLAVASWTYLEAPIPKEPALKTPLAVVGVIISGVPSSGYGSGSVAVDDITAVVLGTRQPVVPKSEERKAFDPSTIKTDPLLEPYHLLRTNLRFAWADTAAKTVLVTSAEMGEGKTTVLSNLGIALAITGKRVVLLDADMRRPQLHRRFGLDRSNGLTELLEQEDPDPDRYLKATGLENLEVLTAGSTQTGSNPAVLLASERMKLVLGRIGERADVVLTDTPPVLYSSDALALMALMDQVLLVIWSGMLRSDTVQRVRDALGMVDAKQVEVVLNRVRRETDAYAYYYNSSYYGKYRQRKES